MDRFNPLDEVFGDPKAIVMERDEFDKIAAGFDPDEDVPLRPERNVVRRGRRPKEMNDLSKDVGSTDDPIRGEQAPMASKEAAEIVGKEVLKGMRQAAKEGEFGSTNINPELAQHSIIVKSISDLAAQFPTINVRIKRKNIATGRYEMIASPKNIDPRTIITDGIEDYVLNWSGGGDYEIEMYHPDAKGVARANFSIAGQQLAPLPERQQAQQAQSFGPFNGLGLPQQAGMPGKPVDLAKYGLADPNAAKPAVDPMIAMMQQMQQFALQKQMMESLNNAPRRDESDAVAKLEARLLEMERRHQEEIRAKEQAHATASAQAELGRKLELLQEKISQAQQPRENPWAPVVAAMAPVAVQMLSKGDAQAQSMAQIFTAIMANQQQSSNTTLEMFKAMQEKPGPEDRFGALIGTMGNMAATNMTMITQLMQTGLLEKGGESPVAQIISQVIGEVADVAKVALGGGGLAMGAPEQPQQEQGATPSLPPPAAQVLPQLPEHIEEQTEVEAEDDSNSYDLEADPAFREILVRLRGGGEPRDIAVRLYKHGRVDDDTQGHPVAKRWVLDPRGFGAFVLNELGIEQGMRETVTAAIETLKAFLAEGGDINTFARPRKRRPLPSMAQSEAPAFGVRFDPEKQTPPATTPSAITPAANPEPTEQPATVEG
jgi:hypothetical protein